MTLQERIEQGNKNTDRIRTAKNSQSVTRYNAKNGTVNLLFNKARYFEMSVYNRALLVSISKAIKVKIQFNNMLCGNTNQCVAAIKAFNKRGYYVDIDIDWV